VLMTCKANLRYPSDTGGWQLGELDLSEYLDRYRYPGLVLKGLSFSQCARCGLPSMPDSINNTADMPQFHRAELELAGERLGYALVEGDVRSGEQRQRDAARGALAGDLIILPGHGQTAFGPAPDPPERRTASPGSPSAWLSICRLGSPFWLASP
jgi:hypothetical protein